MFFHDFFYNVIIINYFWIVLVIVLISCFSHTRPFLVPYAYVSIESIDSILLSSLALNAVLAISLVNTLFFMLLNLCCDFSINLLLF